jgi:hypothetical protein
MAHISSIGAGIYSHLSVTREDVSVSGSEALTAFGTLSETDLGAAFTEEVALGTAVATTAGSFTRISNVREFPSMGTPPNIVNVPVYGQSTSQQIQGQSDAPTMELTINYVGTDWQDTADYFGDMVGDGKQYIFRFALLNSDPTGTGATQHASSAGGLGTVDNTQYFWVGKMEALQVNPQLTDANTATLTISVQSAFVGAFTD